MQEVTHRRKKHKLLILQHKQFGYHTDSYMYSKHIDYEHFSLYYLCFDAGFPKINLDYLTIIYVPYAGGKIRSYSRFIIQSTKIIRENRFDSVFYIKGKFAFVIRLLNLRQHMILDIRTGNLSDNERKRKRKNRSLSRLTHLFKKVSIISESLQTQMKLNPKKAYVLPLGAEKQLIPSKQFSNLNLLYIGSLNKRNIDQTIWGLAIFLNEFNPKIQIRYDIIGFGKKESIHEIDMATKNAGLEGVVHFHGRKKVDELVPFLEKANCGIVYVPQTPYYDCQPSTKLFEYLLAGIPVIATNTYENRRNLQKGCGVLTEDNPEAFSKALEEFRKDSSSYNSQTLKDKYDRSEWKYIVKNHFEPLFDL